ncbi:MAG: hypothetical protein J5700_07120, partial [Treponema sp.]|nr:hypothetical protein [Treponema sp.]
MTIIRKMKKSVLFSGHSLFAGLCASIALVFAFASCETGLGESIDTSAPTVTITYPTSSSSVNGDLVIKGVANDDKSLSKVVLNVKDAKDAAAEVQTFESGISGKEWSVSVSKDKFPDGTYSVDVVAYDGAGRASGTATRVFDVDNTPPVVCLTKPNSLDINDPAAYGRDVTIKGEIADDHAVKQMYVRVFKRDSSTGVVTEIVLPKPIFTGFETAGGTEITIAKYYSESDKPAATSDNYELYLNYKAMYDDVGASMGDTVQYYIFPYFTDAAGNVSEQCYIQSSLKQLLAKACSVDTTSDSLQTAQLKKILNGSYTLGEVDVDTVKSVLDGTYDQSGLSGWEPRSYYASLSKDAAVADVTSAHPLAMSLNANNSPMYEFGGYKYDAEDPAFKFTEVNSKGKVSIKVSAGLDGNEVIANTLKVYLWKCTDTLSLMDGADYNDLSTASYSSDNAVASKKISLVDGATAVSDLADSVKVSNATYTVTLPDNLEAGTYYAMTATGKDVAENNLFSSAQYAFMVAVTGDAPKVEFADQFFVNSKAINKALSASYKAKIQITDKSGDDGKGTLIGNGWVMVKPILYKGYAKTKGYLLDSDKLAELDDIKFEGTQIEGSNGEYYVLVPMNKFDLTGTNKADNYTVALQVQAKNKTATSETTTYIFWADATAPTLEITSPARVEGVEQSEPIYIYENDKNITATTSGGATTYAYTARGTWSDLSGSGACEIWYAWDDPATPVLKWTAASGNAVDGKTYYTKQGDGLYLADTTIATGTSVAGLYTLSVGSGWTAISSAPKSASRANWNQSISSGVTNSSGRKLNFVAVDQTANLSAVKTVSGITFDFAPPSIDLKFDATKEYYVAADKTTDGDYKFQIEIEDASGIQSLVVKAYDKAGTEISSGSKGYTLTVAGATAAKKTATIKLTPTTSDGAWKFVVTAIDTTNRKSEKSFAFTVYNVAPERVWHYTNSDSSKNRWITIGTSGSDSDWHNSENLTLSGKFKEMTSGLEKVVYVVGSGEEQTEIKGGETGEEVLYKITPVGFTEGTNYITINAVDLAGNS